MVWHYESVDLNSFVFENQSKYIAEVEKILYSDIPMAIYDPDLLSMAIKERNVTIFNAIMKNFPLDLDYAVGTLKLLYEQKKNHPHRDKYLEYMQKQMLQFVIQNIKSLDDFNKDIRGLGFDENVMQIIRESHEKQYVLPIKHAPPPEDGNDLDINKFSNIVGEQRASEECVVFIDYFHLKECLKTIFEGMFEHCDEVMGISKEKLTEIVIHLKEDNLYEGAKSDAWIAAFAIPELRTVSGKQVSWRIPVAEQQGYSIEDETKVYLTIDDVSYSGSDLSQDTHKISKFGVSGHAVCPFVCFEIFKRMNILEQHARLFHHQKKTFARCV